MEKRILCVILKIHPEDAKYKNTYKLGTGSIGWFEKNRDTEIGFVSGTFKNLFKGRDAFEHYFYAVKLLKLL